MATVVFDGTRVSQAESETDGGTWDKWGTTQAPVQETDYILQGTFEISNKVTAGTGGVDLDWTTATAFNGAPNRVLIPKFMVSTASILNTGVAEGLSYQIGSGPSAYYNYHIVGSVKGPYPINGGWMAVPIDPNVAAYRDATVGTPNLGSVVYTGLFANMTLAVRSENVIHSALDWVPHGSGLTLTGTAGTFTDFVTTDEGNTANRWRLAAKSDGSSVVFNALATWTIGSATLTTFTDSNKVIKWAGGRVNTGFHGLKLNLTNASTTISISSCTFVSDGVKATNDSRADLNVTGTGGTTTMSNNALINFNAVTLNNKVTFTGNAVVGASSFVPASAAVSSCTFNKPNVATGIAFYTLAASADVPNNSSFISIGTGHAIVITVAGTYTFTNITFTGYGADASNDAAIYNNSGGAVTINVSGGSTPTVRNGAGASTNVVAGAVTVTAKTITEAGAVITGAVVHIEATGTGPFPVGASVTITRSGSTATVTHTAHGLATNDKVVIRGANQLEYLGVFTITKLTNDTYSYTVTGTPASPATGTITSTFVVLNGSTDGTGQISMSRVFSSDQDITGQCRKSTSAPYYKQATISGKVLSASGALVTGVMISDD